MEKLPLILAGPIVRRVEPDLACVWVALNAPRDVRLDVWLGPVTAAEKPAPEFSGELIRTIRVSGELYIALATVVPKTGIRFLPEKAYSYDLTLTPIGLDGSGEPETLGSLGLLKDGDKHLALGYGEGRLPTFVLPPREITNLRVIHGSCRRPQVDVPDAMVWIDDLIRDERDSPTKRPHQLFLTGDQIYADDVSRTVFQAIDDLGRRLFGDERVPTRWPHLDPKKKFSFRSTKTWFPAGLRQVPIMSDADFTTVDGENHLITLGDFAAHYLLVWNRELWPDQFLTAEEYLKALHTGLDSILSPLENDALPSTDPDRENPPMPSPKIVAKLRDVVAGVDESKKPAEERNFPERYAEEVKRVTAFRDGLMKVRRALANVPTYMMFDDHEITDDWFLSAAWRDRVMTSPLGRTIFRNGLVAYALFQGWGNDPRALENTDSPHHKLRQQIEKLVPKPEESFFEPDAEASVAIEQILGFSGEKPGIARWHYSISGPRHQVYVLDCRMRRSFKSRLSGPGNVSVEALKDQIPDKPLPPEIDVVLVVSSLTVLGPPVIDALLGPMLFRIFDFASFVKTRRTPEERANIPGLNPDAIEAWPYDDDAFEALLARVHLFKRVVFLSGDVHFGTSAAMTYFKKANPPARYAQFTSSGFKNKFKEIIVNLERNLSFMQRLATEGSRMERLGWEKKDTQLLKIPVAAKVRPALRARLETSPVLVPTHGWPEGVESTESEWSWRMEVVEDQRPDTKRPKHAQPVELVPGKPDQDVARDVDGVRKAAARHVGHLQRFIFGRRLLFFSNLGVVSFEHRPDPNDSNPDPEQRRKVLTAIHELRAKGPEDPESQVYTHHEVILDPGKEQAPKIPPPKPDDENGENP